MTLVDAVTGETLDTIGIAGNSLTFVTEAARPVLAALTGAYDRRGVAPLSLVDELDGWTDGAVRLQAAPVTLEAGWAPTVPNVLLDLREAGSDRKLRAYWKKHIPWGSPGDFTMCVAKLAKYVKDPEGLCAEYHKQFVGYWPGDRRNK